MNSLLGRANRATYWATLGLIALLLVIFNYFSERPIAANELILIFIMIPRLHDSGKSGWWVLAPIACELAGLVIGFAFFPAEEALGIVWLGLFGFSGFLIWFGITPGDAGPNRFGDPPPRGIQVRGTKRQKADKTLDQQQPTADKF